MKNHILENALLHFGKNVSSSKKLEVLNLEVLTPGEERQVFGGSCDHCKKKQTDRFEVPPTA